jgi:hypothetical protein
MWYQRVEEIVEQLMHSENATGHAATGKRQLETSVAAEDNLSSFKRVRLLQRKYINLHHPSSRASTDPGLENQRAVHSGRCHSCNRSETAEWRPGPDGEGTLCNDCGLDYAMVTRKNVANQQAADSNSDSAILKPAFMEGDLEVVQGFVDQDAEIGMGKLDNSLSPLSVRQGGRTSSYRSARAYPADSEYMQARFAGAPNPLSLDRTLAMQAPT